MTVGKRGTTLASIICFRIAIHEIPFRAPEHAGAVHAHLPAPGRRQEQYRRLPHQARRARTAKHRHDAVKAAARPDRKNEGKEKRVTGSIDNGGRRTRKKNSTKPKNT